MSASLLDNNRTKQMPNFLREADLDINKTDFKLGGGGGGGRGKRERVIAE